MPTSPPFQSLRDDGGGFRWVGSTVMDREQYELEGWHIDGFYVQEDGRREPYWKATLSGLRAYSRLSRDRRAEKKAAWQTREEAEQEFRDYVDALADARPGGRP